jgi:hypothetical protein
MASDLGNGGMPELAGELKFAERALRKHGIPTPRIVAVFRFRAGRQTGGGNSQLAGRAPSLCRSR